MISPISIYTNEIDNFFKALHCRRRVNRPQNEFIWGPTYKDKAGARSVKYPLNNWNGAKAMERLERLERLANLNDFTLQRLELSMLRTR
jgi:hypothetical protein